jgi:hypothetical protein
MIHTKWRHWGHDIRHEVSTHFGKKKRQYLKDNINNLGTNSKNKSNRNLCKDNKKYNQGYQGIFNLVNVGNGDLLENTHNILNNWRNSFSLP